MKSLLQISFAQKQQSSWRAIPSMPGYPHDIHRRCIVASLLWRGRCHVMRQCFVHMLWLQVSVHLTTRKNTTTITSYLIVLSFFTLWWSSLPWILGLFAHAKITLIDLVNQLMRQCMSPVSSLKLLLLVALAIRHGTVCCNFDLGRTCKSSSRTSSWLNMLSLITIIAAIDCVIVCCYLHCGRRISGHWSGHHCDRLCDHLSQSSSWSNLLIRNYHRNQTCYSQW